jgi:hypothetical protein
MTEDFIPYEPPYPIFVIQFDQDGNWMGIFEDTMDRLYLYQKNLPGVNGWIQYVAIRDPLLFFPFEGKAKDEVISFLVENGISYQESVP